MDISTADSLAQTVYGHIDRCQSITNVSVHSEPKFDIKYSYKRATTGVGTCTCIGKA